MKLLLTITMKKYQNQNRALTILKSKKTLTEVSKVVSINLKKLLKYRKMTNRVHVKF